MPLTGCYFDSDTGLYLDNLGRVCIDDGASGNGDPYDWGQYSGGGTRNVPPSITVTPTGVQVAPTNLDKWLQSISQWTALLTHQSSIPTPGANSNSQIRYPSNITPVGVNGLPLNTMSSNLGGNVGASLQKFFSSTTGLLVIGAAVLLYMKPPGRR